MDFKVSTLPDVFVQISLEREPSLAHEALIGHLPGMQTGVSLQVTLLHKALVTRGAGERLLPSVPSHVNLTLKYSIM